jgi:DNA (cytosine-5)-methyltransferase 1
LKNGKNGGKHKIFSLGELFCGPGGLALGAAQARVFSKGMTYGIEHAWANDYHPDSCETFRHNIASQNPDSAAFNYPRYGALTQEEARDGHTLL